MTSPTLSVSDVDADGVEIHRFELLSTALASTVRGLIRDRVVADVQCIEPDHPENHVALVQPLRSRENGDEIELFTPRVVDMEAQVRAAIEGFERTDFAIVIDGTTCATLDDDIVLTATSTVSFVRYNMLIGG